MQKTVKTIFSLLVLATYMVASIGFGIHECSAKGTMHILLINSDTPCEQIHRHCSCSSKSCATGSHSENCCSTEIHHLDLDYDITETGSANFLSNEPLSNDYLPFVLDVSHIMAPCLYASLDFKHGPPIYSSTNQILASLAQWRL